MTIKLANGSDRNILQWMPDNIEATLIHRLHDLKNACFSAEQASLEIKQGYRFDDQHGAAKLQAISDALDILRTEAEILMTLYQRLVPG